MTSTEQGRRKYDAIADRYEEIFFYVGDLGRRLIDFADPAPGSRVLDIGAGRGAVARAALARGCVVAAIDASPGMVERLAADYPEIAARRMDAVPLGFRDEAFDLVTAGFVVQILDDPAAALAQMRRVLAPGGMVALSLETQAAGRMQWLHDLNIEFFAGGQAPPESAGPMTYDQLDDLLAGAGFDNLSRESVQMTQPIADPPALWDWLASRGLREVLRALPEDTAAEFHRRFLECAERMHLDGGITLEFAATLHRAYKPA